MEELYLGDPGGDAILYTRYLYAGVAVMPLLRGIDQVSHFDLDGIRFDVQVVVVRLNIAHPVRYPSNDFRDFWNADYSFGNIVWNFAIGYPF
jgi:hypothetical protein